MGEGGFDFDGLGLLFVVFLILVSQSNLTSDF